MKYRSIMLASFALLTALPKAEATAVTPLSPRQVREIAQQAAPQRAMALAKMIFVSELCHHLTTSDPAGGVQAERLLIENYRLDKPSDIDEENPLSRYRFSTYYYTGRPAGTERSEASAGYCGAVTFINSHESKASAGQELAYKKLVDDVSVIAQGYASRLAGNEDFKRDEPGLEGHKKLSPVHEQLKVAAISFLDHLMPAFLQEPYGVDGRSNMVSTTLKRPLPRSVAGDFAIALDQRLWRIVNTLGELDEGDPITLAQRPQASPWVLPPAAAR